MTIAPRPLRLPSPFGGVTQEGGPPRTASTRARRLRTTDFSGLAAIGRAAVATELQLRDQNADDFLGAAGNLIDRLNTQVAEGSLTVEDAERQLTSTATSAGVPRSALPTLARSYYQLQGERALTELNVRIGTLLEELPAALRTTPDGYVDDRIAIAAYEAEEAATLANPFAQNPLVRRQLQQALPAFRSQYIRDAGNVRREERTRYVDQTLGSLARHAMVEHSLVPQHPSGDRSRGMREVEILEKYQQAQDAGLAPAPFLLNALDAAVTSAEQAEDLDQAMRLVSWAEDFQLPNDTTLATAPDTFRRFAEIRERVSVEDETRRNEQLSDLRVAQDLTKRQATSEYFPIIADAYNSGGMAAVRTLWGTVRSGQQVDGSPLTTRALADFPDAGIAYETIDGIVQQFASRGESNPGTIATVTEGLAAGAIGPEELAEIPGLSAQDRARFAPAASAIAQSRQLLDGSPEYQDVRGRVLEAIELAGLPQDVAGPVTRRFRQRWQALERLAQGQALEVYQRLEPTDPTMQSAIGERIRQVEQPALDLIAEAEEAAGVYRRGVANLNAAMESFVPGDIEAALAEVRDAVPAGSELLVNAERAIQERDAQIESSIEAAARSAATSLATRYSEYEPAVQLLSSLRDIPEVRQAIREGIEGQDAPRTQTELETRLDRIAVDVMDARMRADLGEVDRLDLEFGPEAAVDLRAEVQFDVPADRTFQSTYDDVFALRHPDFNLLRDLDLREIRRGENYTGPRYISTTGLSRVRRELDQLDEQAAAGNEEAGRSALAVRSAVVERLAPDLLRMNNVLEGSLLLEGSPLSGDLPISLEGVEIPWGRSPLFESKRELDSWFMANEPTPAMQTAMDRFGLPNTAANRQMVYEAQVKVIAILQQEQL